jgi:hypothetical protein
MPAYPSLAQNRPPESLRYGRVAAVRPSHQ